MEAGRLAVVLLGTTMATGNLLAQRLVSDINRLTADPGSAAASFAVLGNRVLFAATVAGVGRELFVGDPSVPSAQLLADLAPGGSSSNPRELARVGSLVFFFADDGTGDALWRTDGTAAGTVRLRQLTLHPPSGSGRRIRALNTIALLFADDGTTGFELWRSDGTVNGTQVVVDLEPGTLGGWSSVAAVVGNQLCYGWSAPYPIANRDDLMLTDGTAAGTRVVTSSRTGGPYVYNAAMGVVGNRVLFSGSLPVPLDIRLWVSDGTAAGTVPLSTARGPHGFIGNGAAVLFPAINNFSPQPFVSDATVAGTLPVAGFTELHSAVAVGSTFYALGLDGPSRAMGLWQIVNASASFLGPDLRYFAPAAMVAAGGRVYFRAQETSRILLTGEELWTSDGTPAGTVEVLDIGPGEYNAAIDNLTPFGSGVVFTADDGRIGNEPWFSAGTAATTRPLVNLNAVIGSGRGSNPTAFVDIPGHTLFLADGGDGAELWRTDATAAGTALVSNLTYRESSSLSQPTRLADKALFVYAGRGETAIVQSDGTPAGTQRLNLPMEAPITMLAASSDRVAYTFVRRRILDQPWWRLVRISESGISESYLLSPATPPSDAFAVADRPFFAYDDGSTGRELWSGTSLLRDIAPGPTSSNPGATLRLALGNIALFSATDASGSELWRSDGTAAGTTQVLDLAPGSASSTPRRGVVAGAGAFFVAHSPASGDEVWFTTGTAAGTTLLDVVPGPATSAPSTLVAQHGGVYFAATDATGDRELWFTDGTTAGTRRVVNVAAVGSSSPVVLAAVGTRRVFFTADDGVNGRELYETDGTAAGTRMLGRVTPGPEDPAITSLHVRDDGVLLFPADDGLIGKELFAYTPGAASQPIGSVCGTDILPRLTIADPVLGSNARLEVRSNAASALGVLYLGLPGYASFGAGCRFHLDLTGPLLALPIPLGVFVSALPIPNAGNLDGLVLRAQVLAGPTSTPGSSVDFSNAVALRLGR